MKTPELHLDKFYDVPVFVGNDLVHLPDFRELLNASFTRRAYAESEIAYCEQFEDPSLRYASTWAAKEAVMKALRQAIPEFTCPWKQIVIMRKKASGMPTVQFPDSVMPELKCRLTLSHDGEYAWAIALMTLASS
ncbi:MAG: 4'-phosphopantetheinyl transferase superfamily protein [Verrucomicrobiota bacterium]